MYPKDGTFQTAGLSYNMRGASYGHWPIVPSSPPPCVPQLSSHIGALSHPSRREFTQMNNCSDRRTLICYGRAAIARQSERQVDRQANRRRVRRYEEQETGPCTFGPLSVSRQACVVYISQQGHTVRHVSGPSRHKQMFSGYCCSASPVIVFLQGQPV